MGVFRLAEQQQTHFFDAVRRTVAETRVWLHSAHVEPRGSLMQVVKRLRDCAAKQKLDAAWLSDTAIEAFVEDHLNPRVRAADTPGPAQPISELFAGDDVEAWAQAIGRGLLSLPWKYEVWIVTPMVRSDGDSSQVELGGAYRVVALAPDEASGMRVHEAEPSAGRYHRRFPARVAHEYLHFVASCEGYVRGEDATPELDDVLNAYKGLLGLLVAEGALAFKILPDHVPPRAEPLLIYRCDANGTRELLPYQWLTQEDTWIIHDLDHSGGRRTPGTDSVKLVGPAFRDRATRTAARWYLDSFSRSKGLVQIVQATVALEILLGDRVDADAIGLGTLLANRLAYLTGHTPSQRQEILSDFKQLYDLRSQIVHSGKNRLDDEERQALTRLQRHMQHALHEQIGGLRTEDEWKSERERSAAGAPRSG
jgi:hypothetical protein